MSVVPDQAQDRTETVNVEVRYAGGALWREAQIVREHRGGRIVSETVREMEYETNGQPKFDELRAASPERAREYIAEAERRGLLSQADRHADEDARAEADGEFEPPACVIERAADPLPGGRAQLVQTVFVDGEKVPELSHPVGSPASAETVARHVETIKFGRRS